MFKKAFIFLKDIIWPIFCVDCGGEGSWWCEECWNKYRENFKLVLKCPSCGRSNEDGRSCDRCKVVSYLDKETAFLFYDDKSVVGGLIKKWKYNFIEDISVVWRQVIECGLAEIFANEDVLDIYKYKTIPVPLHPKRFVERGFNQAEVLANILSDIGGFEIIQGLKRVKYTTQQAKLNFWERRENISGAFEWKSKYEVPEKIILVDDVFTSGATMQECAKVLKKIGAKQVWGITLARGEMR